MSQNQATNGYPSGWKLAFPRTRWAMIGFVAGVFTWSFAGGGPQGRATDKANPEAKAEANAEEVEGAVGTFDSTMRRVSQGIQDTTSSVRNGIAGVQGSAHNMNLGAKIRDRLAKEKSIDAERIEVQVKDEGTVVLDGQVPNKADKEEAVNLARDIEGVQRVEDNLSVPPTGRVFAATPEEKAPATRARRTR